MAVFVPATWVAERLESSDVLVLDPRRPVHYLQGHLQGAVNLPVSRAFDPQGRLLPVDGLAAWAGSAGLDARKTPVIYDAYDGRNVAMLAWILEYLGRADARILEVFLERWVAEGRELFYRPVKPVAAPFSARVHPKTRATLEDVRDGLGRKLVDFRSRDEYTGKVSVAEDRPGHIPGAVHLAWSDMLGEDHRFLAPEEKLRKLVAETGIGPGDTIVAYCRTGLRAAVGYLALKQLGFDVVLFDGSYAEWAGAGLPVEFC